MTHAPTPPTPSPLNVDPRTRKVELAISIILRAGVTLSLLVILAGTIVSFVHHPGYLHSAKDLSYLTTPPTTAPSAVPNTLAAIWQDTLAGRGQAIIAAGLMLLIATPVLRVAVSIVAFLLEKDRTFAAITTIVLLLLLLSFLLGHAAG